MMPIDFVAVGGGETHLKAVSCLASQPHIQARVGYVVCTPGGRMQSGTLSMLTLMFLMLTTVTDWPGPHNTISGTAQSWLTRAHFPSQTGILSLAGQPRGASI